MSASLALLCLFVFPASLGGDLDNIIIVGEGRADVPDAPAYFPTSIPKPYTTAPKLFSFAGLVEEFAPVVNDMDNDMPYPENDLMDLIDDIPDLDIEEFIINGKSNHLCPSSVLPHVVVVAMMLYSLDICVFFCSSW